MTTLLVGCNCDTRTILRKAIDLGHFLYHAKGHDVFSTSINKSSELLTFNNQKKLTIDVSKVSTKQENFLPGLE